MLFLSFILHITVRLCSRCEVRLHPGQLTLVPFRRHDEGTSSAPMSTVIHLSDGDTSVQKRPGPDTFTLITRRNKYQWVTISAMRQ